MAKPTANKPQAQSPQFISRRDTATLLCVDPQTIDALVRCGKLSAYRVGRRVILSRSEVLVYLESQRIGERRVQ
jgi:excisionase family DNA binding protein